MGVSKFEELRAWQQARNLTRQIYEIGRATGLRRDFGLRNQLQRAAVSTMANIAEGFGCRSPGEFKNFLGYARRSTIEVQSLLYVCCDAGYIGQADFKQHYEQAEKTKAIITALITSLKA
jgi:four helix bundle protein